VYHDARLAEVLTAHLRHHPAFDAESLAVRFAMARNSIPAGKSTAFCSNG
jgi:hypothetical protein